MPRRPRVCVGGAIHLVCYRATRGERILADQRVARAFVEVLRGVKQRDGQHAAGEQLAF